MAKPNPWAALYAKRKPQSRSKLTPERLVVLDQPELPADRLATIRRQIRDLQAEEDTIRQAMLSQEASLTGELGEAEIRTSCQRRISYQTAKAHLTQDLLDRVAIEHEITTITLRRRHAQ